MNPQIPQMQVDRKSIKNNLHKSASSADEKGVDDER